MSSRSLHERPPAPEGNRGPEPKLGRACALGTGQDRIPQPRGSTAGRLTRSAGPGQVRGVAYSVLHSTRSPAERAGPWSFGSLPQGGSGTRGGGYICTSPRRCFFVRARTRGLLAWGLHTHEACHVAGHVASAHQGSPPGRSFPFRSLDTRLIFDRGPSSHIPATSIAQTSPARPWPLPVSLRR